MSLDTSLFDTENLPENLDKVRINTPLHTLNSGNEKFQHLVKLFSQEGQWCKLVSKKNVSQFQIGKRGLYVSKDDGGNRYLKIDVLKRKNWSLNGRNEGFVLSSDGFTVEGNVPLPTNYFNSSSYQRNLSFGRSHSVYLSNSSKVSSFSIGDFDSSRNSPILKDYAITRTNSIPFNVSFSENLCDDAIKMALMSYQNALVDEGLLERKLMSIGSSIHGVTLESMGRNNLDPENAKVLDWEKLSWQERDQIEKDRGTLHPHIELAKQEMIRVHAIKKVWWALSRDSTLYSSGMGNGFNGIFDYYSGYIGEFRKGKSEFSQLPMYMTLCTNPLKPHEVWVKPSNIGGRKKAMIVYDNSNGGRIK